MKKRTTLRVLLSSDDEEAWTCRYLRVCRALFGIDDPGVEEAVMVVDERLSQSPRTSTGRPAVRRRPRKAPGPWQRWPAIAWPTRPPRGRWPFPIVVRRTHATHLSSARHAACPGRMDPLKAWKSKFRAKYVNWPTNAVIF